MTARAPIPIAGITYNVALHRGSGCEPSDPFSHPIIVSESRDSGNRTLSTHKEK